MCKSLSVYHLNEQSYYHHFILSLKIYSEIRILFYSWFTETQKVSMTYPRSLRWKVRELAFNLRSVCFQTVLSRRFSLLSPFSNPYGMASLWKASKPLITTLSHFNQEWKYSLFRQIQRSYRGEKFLNNESFSEYSNPFLNFSHDWFWISINPQLCISPIVCPTLCCWRNRCTGVVGSPQDLKLEDLYLPIPSAVSSLKTQW